MRLPHVLYSLTRIHIAAFSAAGNGLPTFLAFEVSSQDGEYHLNRLESVHEIPKGSPTVLLAYGNGVITRITKEQEQPFDELIPQHRQSEFTHFHLPVNDLKVTCFALNSLFDSAAACMEQVNIVRQGFATIEGLNGGLLINQDGLTITLPGISVENKHGALSITAAAGNAAQQFMGEEYLPEELAVLLAGISLLAHRTEIKLSYPDSFEYFTLKRSLHRIYGAALSLIFAVLLLNYLQYSSLLQQHPMIEAEISSMKLRKAAAEAQVKALGVTETSASTGNLALLSDRIGAITPSGITLTTVSFNPMKGQVEAGDISEVQQKKVEISGTALASSQVNELLNRVSKEAWVGKSSLSDLSFLNEKGFYRFTITAQIK